MAVEVHSDMGDDYDPEAVNSNSLLLCIVGVMGDGAPSEGVAVREIVRMLRNAADGAADIHLGDPAYVREIAKLRTFSEHMTAALKVIL